MKKKRFKLHGLVLFPLAAILLSLAMLYHSFSLDSWITVFSILILLLMTGMLVTYFRRLQRPIRRMESYFDKLQKGELPHVEEDCQEGIAGELAEPLSRHVSHLESVIAYAKRLASGDISEEFKVNSDRDELGQSLFRLHESLVQSSAEAERRRREDEQRNWMASGLARFSELLRNAEDDPDAMAGLFIRHLVDYLEVEVGAIFLTEQEEGKEPELVMKGSYAFDREKHDHKKFGPGEGLVGRCAVEKETIYINEVPGDYIRIRSGMGEDKPAVLILTPVVLDREVLGVIEVAAFSQVPSYKIQFLESLSESIAATISKIKINIKTARLLQQSRQQADELSSQEEEMRQSMEEMRSIQEQSAKREQELNQELKKLRQELGKNDR